MADETKDRALLLVRATITLPDLRLGQVVEVDPEVAYIKDCLSVGYLVPVGPGSTDAGP